MVSPWEVGRSRWEEAILAVGAGARSASFDQFSAAIDAQWIAEACTSTYELTSEVEQASGSPQRNASVCSAAPDGREPRLTLPASPPRGI
jgi:hypothetical protein